MPESPAPITQPSLLLVEGKEDEAFFGALLDHLHLRNVQIEAVKGRTEFPKTLKAIKMRTGYYDNLMSIGIIRDGDANPPGAFQSICSPLKNAQLPVPRKPLQVVGSSPRVSVMILPGVKTAGMLEDVCLASIEQHLAIPCVNQYFECLIQQGFSVERQLSKARVQVFLAALEPELRLGEAAAAGYWDWNHPAFSEMKDFLTQFAASTEN